MIPDYTIEKLLNHIIAYIRNDYKEQTDEKASYLYFLTNNIGIQRLNLFDQAKTIFLTEKGDEKRLRVYLQFPQDMKTGVAVCITHSGESHGQNVLGVDQNHFFEDEYIESETEEPSEEENEYPNAIELGISKDYRNSYSRRYQTKYNIIITGDNTNESLITFLILKSVLISLEGTSHLSHLGFTNLKISSSDMQIKSDIAKIMFAKTISLEFEYEFKVPSVYRQKTANAIIFNGIMKDKII